MPKITDAPSDPSAVSVRPSDAAAAGCLPRKSFECELKADEGSGPGGFELYAAVFGNKDRQGDIIEPGAFDNLPDFERDGWGAINHKGYDLPIGYITSAEQDVRGLKVRGIFHSTPTAQECRTVVLERMKAGKRVLCSIGYVTRDESMERIDGEPVRRITRLSVFEFSFVNLPANDQAAVTSAKGADPMPEAKTTPPAETKRSVAISAANREKMSRFSEEMDGHHETMKKCMKSMADCHKAMGKTHDEYKAWAKAFEPAEADDDDDGGEEGRKAKDPVDDESDPADTDDGNPPKGKAAKPAPAKRVTDDDIALSTWRDQLKQRSMAGRRVAACP